MLSSMNLKYTREKLEPIVLSSRSINEVLRKLGLRFGGGIHAHISRRIKILGINTSHFLGQGANRGPNHAGGPDKKDWNEILIKRKSGGRQKAWKLRRALLEMGRAYVCHACGNAGWWQGKALTLQVNHKNGDWLDDRPANLDFDCPNCHSQTEGWSGDQGLTDLTSEARYQRERRKKRNARVA